jgi:hypothetical protein
MGGTMSITLNGTTGITTPDLTSAAPMDVGGSAVLTAASDVLTSVSSLASANLTGALPAISGAALTGLPAPAAGTALFSAKFSNTAWYSLAIGGVVPFNAKNFDADGVYDRVTNYNFTAPATGVYMFWYSIYTALADASNGFGIYKNNSVLSLQNDAVGSLSYVEVEAGDHIQSATVVIPLNGSDTIQVRATVTSGYYSGISQWGGVRIS